MEHLLASPTQKGPTGNEGRMNAGAAGAVAGPHLTLLRPTHTHCLPLSLKLYPSGSSQPVSGGKFFTDMLQSGV